MNHIRNTVAAMIAAAALSLVGTEVRPRLDSRP